MRHTPPRAASPAAALPLQRAVAAMRLSQTPPLLCVAGRPSPAPPSCAHSCARAFVRSSGERRPPLTPRRANPVARTAAARCRLLGCRQRTLLCRPELVEVEWSADSVESGKAAACQRWESSNRAVSAGSRRQIGNAANRRCCKQALRPQDTGSHCLAYTQL